MVAGEGGEGKGRQKRKLLLALINRHNLLAMTKPKKIFSDMHLKINGDSKSIFRA